MNTEGVRAYVIATVLEPSRRRGHRRVRVHVGEVARALQLRGRFPLICNALRAKKFLAAQGLTIEKDEGPRSGLSSSVVFTYRLEPARSQAEPVRQDWFLPLRGLLRGMYDDDGGVEAYLGRQRQGFYSRRRAQAGRPAIGGAGARAK